MPSLLGIVFDSQIKNDLKWKTSFCFELLRINNSDGTKREDTNQAIITPQKSLGQIL